MKLISSIIILLIFTNCANTNQFSKGVTTTSGLKYTVVKNGDGERAKPGQEVAIYETMSYLGGTHFFYSIEKPAQPIKFTLGKKQVIDGVDEGVTGMKVGEIRRLIVPPSLSKRSRAPGPFIAGFNVTV